MPASKRVVIAGGGPAAVETLLALRKLAGDRVELALVAPEPELVVRAYEVLAPFHDGREHRYELSRIASDVNAELIRDALASVDTDARTVALRFGDELAYETLVVAVGARPIGTLAGAMPFHGARDAAKLKELLLASDSGRHGSVAFIVPSGQTWPLPLYELALHTAAWLSGRGIGRVPLTVVSPEGGPLASFGGRVSDEVRALLQSHHIEFVGGHVVRHEPGRLLLAGGRELASDLAIALPRLGGPAIHGLPHDADGFLPADENGRVAGAAGVFAAGDATDFPIKQGGLATQQADAIAELLSAELDDADPPERAAPVLRAVLYAGREKRYLRAELGEQLQASSQASSSPLWPESSKLVGRYLASYLDALDRVAR